MNLTEKEYKYQYQKYLNHEITNELEVIIDYKKQQEKQEKLLELYKYLSLLRNDMLSIAVAGGVINVEMVGKEEEMEKQIKELEK